MNSGVNLALLCVVPVGGFMDVSLPAQIRWRATEVEQRRDATPHCCTSLGTTMVTWQIAGTKHRKIDNKLLKSWLMIDKLVDHGESMFDKGSRWLIIWLYKQHVSNSGQIRKTQALAASFLQKSTF